MAQADAGRLRTLAGNTRGEANADNDRGKAADDFAMEHMQLQLRRTPEREQEVKAFIERLHDPASPDFHKWLTAAEYGNRFGAAPRDIQKVTRWLEANGFTVNTVYPSAMAIDFSGTAGKVQAAFHTEIHKLVVNGKEHTANMSDPQIPEELAQAVLGITSLHDFRPRPMKRARAKYTSVQGQSTYRAVGPADLATIYDLSPLFAAGFSGQGQTVAVVEDSNLYSANDWTSFRTILGLGGYTSGSLITAHPAPASGRSNCSNPGATSDDVEAITDAEWASAAAPSARILVAACANTSTTFGGLIALQNLINGASPPQVISVSYGECEAVNGAASNATYNSAYQQAVAEGVSVFVSAGDEGAASCDAGFPAATHGIGVSAFASTPYNIAVGGTDFADSYQGTAKTYWSASNTAADGSALSYIPEIPWNSSCASGLLASSQGYSTPYGSSGFCASAAAQANQLNSVAAGSGGPSGCATGTPANNMAVGGDCQGYAKPAWQAGIPGIANDGVRDIPDVSMFAADGVWGHFYLTCYSDTSNGGTSCSGDPVNWGGNGGGTSYAAPVMAGIQALINQKMGGAQGNPAPVYYKLAAGPLASSVFHSISSGDISVNCSGSLSCFGPSFVARGRGELFDGNGVLSTSNKTYLPAFAASAGWNFATGIGSVDAYNLVMNWSKGQ